MAKSVHARRFSQAVFEIALETKELDRWQSDLRRIATLGEDARLVAWLESPKFHFEDKAKLLSELMDDINPLALNLVYLLVTKSRLRMAGEIADEYQRLLDSYRGVEQAEVTTTFPLAEEDIVRLEKRLRATVGKKVVVKPKVDTSIIGGLVARIGGKLLDGSTRSKLAALKRELMGVG